MDLFDSEGKRLSSATGTNASIRINVRYEPMHTFSNTQAATGPICWRGLIDGAFCASFTPLQAYLPMLMNACVVQFPHPN